MQAISHNIENGLGTKLQTICVSYFYYMYMYKFLAPYIILCMHMQSNNVHLKTS